MKKLESLFEDYKKLVVRLEEVLSLKEHNDITRDSAIKRFEMLFDIGWKTLKAHLEEEHNLSPVSPRATFREAFRVGLIPYDEFWITLTSERNYTVHAYSEKLANHIFANLPKALANFRALLATLLAEHIK